MKLKEEHWKPITEKTYYAKREIQVLLLQQQGYTYKEIAEKLGIQTNTVRAYVTKRKNKYLKALRTVKYLNKNG